MCRDSWNISFRPQSNQTYYVTKPPSYSPLRSGGSPTFLQTYAFGAHRLIGLCLAPVVLLSCDEKRHAAVPTAVSTQAVFQPSVSFVENQSEAFLRAITEDRLEDARSLLDKVSDEDYRRFLTNQFNAAMEHRIRKRAKENPRETLEWIARGGGGVEMFWMEVAMAEYLSADREAAVAWHKERTASLNQEQNDRVDLARARHLLTAGNWRSAKEINGRILNAEVKKAVADEIGAAMERDLRAQVRAGGAEAMARLIAGDSGFELFWIEVAMNEYMAADPTGAKEWYAVRGSRLTIEQHDRVALAYARSANHAGNKPMATEWADQIRDKALREVVVGEIGG
jgi:hypothetical protein